MTISDDDRPKKASFIKIRFLIFLMGTLCPVVCYMSRQNLSMAMVAMIKDSSNPADSDIKPTSTLINQTQEAIDTNTCPAPTIIGEDGKLEEAPKIKSYGPKYDWTNSQRSLIFETFFWTYMFCQIPAARLAETIGAKWILTTATVGSSILSFLSPWAASIHPYAMATVRALMGISQTALYPACYVLFTQWLPPAERSQALPILGAAAYIGSIITSAAAGYFSEQESLGWEYAFYMPSVLCAIWSILWIFIGTSEPRQHHLISLEEIEYIESRMEIKRKTTDSKKSISWKKIATSQHIWALAAASLASNWSFGITLLLLPSYLNYVLQIPPFKNGLINSVIYTLFVISSPIVGAVSALMIETRTFGMSRIHIRKLFQSIAVFSQAICFISIPLIGCDTNLVLGTLYLQVVLFSCFNGGELQIPAELSLDFAGTIFAIANCIGSSTGFIVPRVHSLIVDNVKDKTQWNTFFFLAAAITTIGGLIFLIFGRNDLQDYSKDAKETKYDIYALSTERTFDLELEASGKSKKDKQSTQITLS